MRIARKYVSEDHLVYLENIDFRELRKAVDVLKRYRGLQMVDIRGKDGTEVRIEI